MSPFQKSRGFSSGQMFANSQCLLKISAGLDFPSFQLNWRYPAAMAVNPNRDSPNGYLMVTPAKLQPVTLAH